MFTPAVIKQARKKKNLTQERLALLAGICTAGLNAIENGKQIPKASTVAKILSALSGRKIVFDYKKIKQIRIAKNISQVELAEFIGISNVNLNRIENGLSDPRITTVIRIAQVLQVRLKDFFLPLY